MIFFVDFLSFLDIFMLLISSNIDYTLYFGRIFSCKGNYFDFYSIENIFLVLTFFASSICCLKNRLAISLHFNSSQCYDNFNIFPTTLFYFVQLYQRYKYSFRLFAKYSHHEFYFKYIRTLD